MLGLIESGGLNSVGSEDLALVIKLNSVSISVMLRPGTLCRVAITTSGAERAPCTVEQQSADIWSGQAGEATEHNTHRVRF